MAPNFQSIYRWDRFVQSEVNELAISPNGDFVAVAASQGAVFIFETATGAAIHFIQLQINDQPTCCFWVLQRRDHEDWELELFVGTANGIVVSIWLSSEVRPEPPSLP